MLSAGSVSAAGAASALGAGFSGFWSLRPLIIALSCAISCCSCSSCGNSTSGAFLGCRRGFAVLCCSAGLAAGTALCRGVSGFTAAGGSAVCGADFSSGFLAGASGCASSASFSRKGHGASSCSGSASGFSISSRSASGSGCASSPSRTSPVGISCGCSAAASSVSCFSLPRPNRPNRFCGFSSGWFSSLRVISSGISTAVVLKKERNFSSGVISRPLFLSFGILVPPVIQIEVPARMPDHACCAARWDWISYRIMPAATDTL